jgi:hypothetical protein
MDQKTNTGHKDSRGRTIWRSNRGATFVRIARERRYVPDPGPPPATLGNIPDAVFDEHIVKRLGIRDAASFANTHGRARTYARPHIENLKRRAFAGLLDSVFNDMKKTGHVNIREVAIENVTIAASGWHDDRRKSYALFVSGRVNNALHVLVRANFPSAHPNKHPSIEIVKDGNVGLRTSITRAIREGYERWKNSLKPTYNSHLND